jgi:sigma-E factor negative regulatory protein RseB
VLFVKVKFRVAIFLLLFAATTAAIASAFSQEDLNWLKKMTIATRQSEYSGTFIYQSGNYVETSRITHVLVGGDEYERLEGLDGERSEIIRKNDQVWCYLGDSKVMVAKRQATRTFPALLPEQLDLLQENYLISHGDEDRVAGFHAHTIIFHPRDHMRYSHKMWAYTETGLLLKAVVIDDHNRTIEQYAFTQLNIGGNIDRNWIHNEEPSGSKNTDSPDNAVSSQYYRPVPLESGWKVQALPPGFKKIAEVSRRLRGNDFPVIHMVYSDGLAGISVFIEKIVNKANVKKGLYNKGITHIYIRTVGDNLLTVVGEVPARTVMQVADSVKDGE